MRTEDNKKLLLSDTSIPDLFFSEYMSGLSEIALKSYLLLCVGAKALRCSVTEKDLGARLSLAPDDVKSAVNELIFAELVERVDKGVILLRDLKQVEIDGYIRVQMDSTLPPEASKIRPQDKDRDDLTRSIEKTFFTGSMGYKWYRQVDILLDDFHFEQDVVYRLFLDCYEKKQLQSLTQMKERAILWQSKGITNMAQLSEFLAHEEDVAQTIRKIGKILRRKMVSYDEDCVRVWIERLNYSFEMIDFAIKKVWEFQEPSLNKADAYLKSWFAAGVRTLPDAHLYEEDRARKNKISYQKNKEIRNTASATQNFEGVKYNEEFLNSLDTDPSAYLRKLTGDN